MPRQRAEESDPLVIDRAAAAERPSAEAIGDWARDKRVFVSSVMSELGPERQAASEAIRKIGARSIMFEEFGGRDADPEDAYLGEVETSHIYLGILGRRYGKPLKSRFSATHTEYLHAEKCGLRIAVWALRTDDREGHEQAFLDEVRVFHVAPEFKSPEDLARQVEQRLTTIAAEDLSPWCKLGNLVFRASRVSARSDQVVVTAQVRSDDVAHALESHHGDRWNRGDLARFAWAGRSRHVRVKEVESATTSARSRMLELHLDIAEPPQDHTWEVTVGKFTPDDQTEIALRHTLFGEPNPLADQHMGFFGEMPDPLEPLRVSRAPDEIHRPLAELLIVDALVGSGRAARVTEFSLGVSVRGIRQLKLSWEPPRRYSNEGAQRRSISGQVRL
jgi:hypothetical protein